jgi:hypothetical protein
MLLGDKHSPYNRIIFAPADYKTCLKEKVKLLLRRQIWHEGAHTNTSVTGRLLRRQIWHEGAHTNTSVTGRFSLQQTNPVQRQVGRLQQKINRKLGQRSVTKSAWACARRQRVVTSRSDTFLTINGRCEWTVTHWFRLICDWYFMFSIMTSINKHSIQRLTCPS